MQGLASGTHTSDYHPLQNLSTSAGVWVLSILKAVSFGVLWCHVVSFGVPRCPLVSRDVPWCPLVSRGVLWCHVVSFGVSAGGQPLQRKMAQMRQKTNHPLQNLSTSAGVWVLSILKAPPPYPLRNVDFLELLSSFSSSAGGAPDPTRPQPGPTRTRPGFN